MSNKSLIQITKTTRSRLNDFKEKWFNVSNDDELVNDMVTELEKAFDKEEETN